MKLSPKPKPVRIRISLGGIEHTTLESLKENITPEILNFTDGRLQRWLEKLGEDDLADKIGKISNTECRDKRLLYVYNAIFEKDCTTIAEYLDEWCKDKAYYKSARGILFWKKDDIHYVKGVFNQYPNLLDDNEWVELADLYNDHDFSYIIGKKLLENGDVERAKKIIKAVVKDNSEAESFYKTHFKERSIFKDTPDNALLDVVNDWEKVRNITYTKNTIREITLIEKEVKIFILNCVKAFTEDKKPYHTGRYYDLNFFSDICKFIEAVLYKNGYTYLKDEVRCAIILAKKYQCNRCNYNISAESTGEYKEISEDCKFKKEISSIRFATQACLTKIINYILFEKDYTE